MTYHSQRHKELSLHLTSPLWELQSSSIDATHLCLLPSEDNYCHAMDCAKTQDGKNEFHAIPALKEYRCEEEKENRHFFFFWFWGFLHCGKNTSHEINPLHKLLGVLLAIQYSIVSYRHSAVQRVSRIFFILHNWNLYPLITISLFPNPLAPDNYHSTLCFFEFDCFKHLIYVESYSIHLFVTHLFNLV